MRPNWRLAGSYRKAIERKTVGSMIGTDKGAMLFGEMEKDEERKRQPVDPKLDSAVAKLLESKDGFSSPLCALVLRQCGQIGALDQGRRVHEHMEKCGDPGSSIFLSNLLVQMYGKCGDAIAARRAFDSMIRRNRFTWSLMLSAYARNGYNRKALDLYREMGREECCRSMEFDDILLATLLGVCASLGDLELGREIHSKMTRFNIATHTALVYMYARCGRIGEARAVFDAMIDKDVKAWTVMISAYARNGDLAEDALRLFRQIDVVPDCFTYSSALAACSSLGDLAQGRDIHMRILKSGLIPDQALHNALINMYAKCGSMEDARKLFDLMRRKDVISWTCLIGGYTQNGQFREALELYKQMHKFLRPNSITHASALTAAAGLGDVAEGQAIHDKVMNQGLESAAVVGCSLINMYAKCSRLNRARAVFDKLPFKDEVCGNAMLAAYAQFGHLPECVQVVREMANHGSNPSVVTLVSLLLGCTHAGSVEDGRRHFVELVGDFDLQPVIENYLCMVDLLGRSGRLHECEELIDSMPFEPQPIAWITLLAACKVHGDVERGERASRKVSKLEPGSANHRVLMSTILAMTLAKKQVVAVQS